VSHGSKNTVITAVVGNLAVTIAKFIGAITSGSSAMLAEAVHSLADTANQSLLLLGLNRSERVPDAKHPFGYGPERYFWNLVSAITIFFIGCIYTIFHAYSTITDGGSADISLTILSIIFAAFLIEGYSFSIALKEFNSQRKETGHAFVEYLRESRDPTTIAVLVEDSVAMLGLTFAGIGMGLTLITGNSIFDGVAAILIGILMGCLAYFLAWTNMRYLINLSDKKMDDAAMKIWRKDQRIQDIHRINSIVLSPKTSILMAEIELREEEMFKDMSPKEVEMAIEFMGRLDIIRKDLEDVVKCKSPQAEHIFVEFVGVQNKAPHAPKK